MKFLLLLAFAAVAVAAPNGQITTFKDIYKGENNERIIGGSPAKVGQFPWQVAIIAYTSQGNIFCGGSLLNNRWVLTAAHCAHRANSFKLQLGILTLNEDEDGRLEFKTSYSVIHYQYNAYLNNDVALIYLPESIKFTDKIRPIKLPSRGSHVDADQAVTISGWGKTSDQSNSVSNILNYVQLRSISNAECLEVYGYPGIINSTLCCKGASYHNTCHGDSGGPLVTFDSNGEAIQVGVVSFGHTSGCSKGYPSGYARIEYFLDWINRNTGIPI